MNSRYFVLGASVAGDSSIVILKVGNEIEEFCWSEPKECKQLIRLSVRFKKKVTYIHDSGLEKVQFSIGLFGT